MNGNNVDFMSMGKRIRQVREELNLTQSALAAKVRTSTSFVGHLERGEKLPSLEVFCRFCEALGVTADYLLCGRKHMCNKADCGVVKDLAELVEQYRGEQKNVDSSPRSE